MYYYINMLLICKGWLFVMLFVNFQLTFKELRVKQTNSMHNKSISTNKQNVSFQPQREENTVY